MRDLPAPYILSEKWLTPSNLSMLPIFPLPTSPSQSPLTLFHTRLASPPPPATLSPSSHLQIPPLPSPSSHVPPDFCSLRRGRGLPPPRVCPSSSFQPHAASLPSAARLEADPAPPPTAASTLTPIIVQECKRLPNVCLGVPCRPSPSSTVFLLLAAVSCHISPTDACPLWVLDLGPSPSHTMGVPGSAHFLPSQRPLLLVCSSDLSFPVFLPVPFTEPFCKSGVMITGVLKGAFMFLWGPCKDRVMDRCISARSYLIFEIFR